MGIIDLSGSLSESVLQLRKELPLELVVSMFQKLVRFSRTLLVTCSYNSMIESSPNPIHARGEADRDGDEDRRGVITH